MLSPEQRRRYAGQCRWCGESMFEHDDGRIRPRLFNPECHCELEPIEVGPAELLEVTEEIDGEGGNNGKSKGTTGLH